jgi:hypothetical protein
MIKNRRLWGVCAVLGGAALLGGCVAVPGGSYGYSEPYYADPGPVVVQPNVYIDGSYGGGYYSRPRYGYPYYGGRPGYHPHPGHPRAGWGGRPSAVVPVPPPAHLGPRSGGGAGVTVPVPPGRSPREINRMLNSPDSRTQTPP